ncbi:hypothetical protein [Methylobacterium sp. Leaf118]|uniref:hypothetical protein n=1 Tax=Methylobacterium sp. Leaf118 TaxID=2876562 RepID=UPI001E563F73|nr:hypothetical protein [Methylobacterium sp. Leaf118]
MAPAYFTQRRLDGLYAIYDARGPVLGYEAIETRGDAEAHILDLIERDRREAAAIDECVAGFDALLAEAA